MTISVSPRLSLPVSSSGSSSPFTTAVDCKTNGDASLAWLVLPAIKGFHVLLAAASSSCSFCCCCCLHLVTVSFNFKRHLSLVPKTFRLTLFRQVTPCHGDSISLSRTEACPGHATPLCYCSFCSFFCGFFFCGFA